MEQWLTDNKLPIGRWIKNIIDYLLDNGAFLFDTFADGLKFLIEGVSNILLWFPALVLVAILTAAVYLLHRSIKLSIMVLLGLLLVINLGYWTETIQTFTLILFATAICILIGVPTGIAMAHRPWLANALRPVLDLMQTIPTFVYLIPTMIMFGLGVVPGLISTAIFALPAPIRLTSLGIASVPKALIEAGQSFGGTKRQILWKIEIPYAMPNIMAGITQCIMLSLSMVVIAALVGAPGLGVPVVRALNTVNIAKGFEAGLAIVVVAILLDRVFKTRKKRQG